MLGERPDRERLVAMAMALSGIVVLTGSNGVVATQSKLPGIALAFTAAFMFALSAVLAKPKLLRVPPLTGAVWQIEIGWLIVTLAGLAFEQPHLLQLTPLGWACSPSA